METGMCFLCFHVRFVFIDMFHIICQFSAHALNDVHVPINGLVNGLLQHTLMQTDLFAAIFNFCMCLVCGCG